MMLKWWSIEISCPFSFHLCLKGKDPTALHGKRNPESDRTSSGLIKSLDGKSIMTGGAPRRSWRGEVCWSLQINSLMPYWNSYSQRSWKSLNNMIEAPSRKWGWRSHREPYTPIRLQRPEVTCCSIQILAPRAFSNYWFYLLKKHHANAQNFK